MSVKNKIIIGSRASKLALWQSRFIADNLKKLHPGLCVEIIKIKTKGDKILDAPLAKIGDKGLFVKELEDALLECRIDLAVHSLKDVPTQLPEGLCIGAVTKREDAADVLISAEGLSLEQLVADAVIGTSSLRRQAQLLNYSPQFRIVDLRGNLDTRLAKLTEQKLDAIILAAAGICRLGWQNKISQRIPFDICLPAVGQGALGLEIRISDDNIKELLTPLNDTATEAATKAERALLGKLEGGCQVPLGAYGEIIGEQLRLRAVVASIDGKLLIKDELTGSPACADSLGLELAKRMLDKGARHILAEIVSSSG